MSESNPEIPVKAPLLRRNPFARLRQNPVTVKELRGRMRGNRAFILLTLYLLVLSGLVSLVYLAFLASNQTSYSVTDRQLFGKIIFGVVVWMELLTVSFISPALTSGAISAERERQTFDLLRTTLLPARSLVLGKFLSGLVYVLLLIFAALPLQSLAFMFGGVTPQEFWIATLMLVVTAVTFCAVGLYFSSRFNRTLVATVLSYAFALLLVFGLPMLLLMALALNGNGFGGQMSVRSEMILLVVGWVAVMLNPLATAVVTEVILLDQQGIGLFHIPLSNGVQITLLSPWLPYALLYLAFSLLLLWSSVRLVRRPEK